MKKLLFRGPVLTRSGYGEQARFALRCLLSRPDEWDIYIHPTEWGKTNWMHEINPETEEIKRLIDKCTDYKGKYDISLQVTIPNEFEKLAPINIGYTAGIETNKIAPHWIEKASLMDRIIVVSNHAKTVFDTTKYEIRDQEGNPRGWLQNETEIYPVQYAVRNPTAKPINIDHLINTDFNFLTVAQAGPRKNLTTLVDSFIKEFHDEEGVGLILKTFSKNNSFADRKQTKNSIRAWVDSKYPDKKCSLYMLHGNLTEEEMHGLYQNENIHAYCTLTHGEGFGLPIFEAAINKLPVIAPAWSGHTDFLYMPVKNEKSGREKITPLFQKVSYELKNIPKEAVWEGVLQADSMWCYPKEKSAQKAMRSVYQGYNFHKKNAELLSDMIMDKFSEEKMYAKFCDVVLGTENAAEEQRVHLL